MPITEILKIIFISLCAIVVIGGIVFGCIVFYKKVYYPKNFRIVNYGVVRRIVKNEDFRLINNFSFKVEQDKKAIIDHIIGGNKYVYIVLSRYYDGELSGNMEDMSFVFIDKKGVKYYTDNPYKYADYILSRFSTRFGIDKSILIGIVMTNNNCKMAIKSNDTQNYVISKKGFKKLIKSLESSDISDFNDQSVENVFISLHEQNEKKHDKPKTNK